MNHDDDDAAFDADEPGSDAILELLQASAEWLVADPDPQAFIARMAREGPQRFAGMLEAEAEPGAVGDEPRFFTSLGWAILNAMPMPGNGFQPIKLPMPGRNEACVCGSGRKFKQCCAGLFANLPVLEPQLLGALVIRALPAARWAVLPGQHVAPGMVAGAAEFLSEEGRLADAIALLQPWSQLPAPWPDGRAELLDFLGDLYLDAGLQTEREHLARAMVERGGKAMQSLGWQRLCLLATDAGDKAGAAAAFEKAQRLTPNDPRVGLLEVTTLLGQGQAQKARERAAFHAKRLSRLPNAFEIAEQIEVLEEFADADSPMSREADAMFRGAEAAPALRQLGVLEAWLLALPPPQLRLTLPRAPCDDLGQLRPNAAAAKALRQWRQAFDLEAPRMAFDTVDDEDALDAFDSVDWLPLLQAQPLLADCFEVIDGLVSMLEVVPVARAATVQSLLMVRAIELWALLRARHPAALCEWGHLGNRPALRLLAWRVDLDTTPKAESSFVELEHLVTVLNPNDNHGLRQRLAAVCLRRGEAARALALCERYPEDTPGMSLLHARALLAAQRLTEAAALLADALERNPHLRKLLQAARAPRRPTVASYGVGSSEEARITLAEQFDLWRDDPAVKLWLREQLASRGAATPGLFD